MITKAKKAAAVVALVVASLGASAAAASADEVRQDDLAPHSTAPVTQTGVINTNGDTNITGVGKVLVPVNVVVGGVSGPQQTGNETAAPQLDNDTAAGRDVLRGLL